MGRTFRMCFSTAMAYRQIEFEFLTPTTNPYHGGADARPIQE